jgi:hypothetical protein
MPTNLWDGGTMGGGGRGVLERVKGSSVAQYSKHEHRQKEEFHAATRRVSVEY